MVLNAAWWMWTLSIVRTIGEAEQLWTNKIPLLCSAESFDLRVIDPTSHDTFIHFVHCYFSWMVEIGNNRISRKYSTKYEMKYFSLVTEKLFSSQSFAVNNLCIQQQQQTRLISLFIVRLARRFIYMMFIIFSRCKSFLNKSNHNLTLIHCMALTTPFE